MSKTGNMEKNKDFYNLCYKNGGSNKEYFKNPDDCIYADVWKEIVNILKNIKKLDIIDFGCGNGQFSRYIQNKLDINKYIGYDFSNFAINYANKNNKNINFTYEIKNFNNMEKINLTNKTFICLEVLEHINNDLNIIKKMTSESEFVFSVPNYNSKGHVRIFKDKSEIYKRYDKLLNIENINIVNIGKHGNKIFIFYGTIK